MNVGKVAGSVCALALFVAVCSAPPATKSTAAIVVPKIWDERELAGWATPLAGLGVPPSFFSEKEYYAAPVDNLRTYPVYHPNREPAGYRDWMKRQGPRPLIDPATLRSEADWIEAGRCVFEQLDDVQSRSSDPIVLDQFSDPRSVDKYIDATHDIVAADGSIPDYRWVVDRDGALKLGFSSCAGCHTRLMSDGTLLPGAPCNFDLADSPAATVMLRQVRISPSLTGRQEAYAEFGVPWLEGDANDQFRSMSDEEFARFDSQDSGEPVGTMFNRFNGSPFYKTRMADLRGIRHRKYLDATGTHLHRGPEDLARYCILVEFADCGVFGEHKMLPPDAMKIRCRPPDEAVYAMALYLESLEPPPSPYPFDESAKRGQEVFESEGCGECHTPPYYTNNKLVAVPGFEPGKDEPAVKRSDVSTRRVGTDPGLALRTRKGTGYYKVPSLRGVWYRGLYEHDGSVASLEDWFDDARLEKDYSPSGWRGPGVKTRAVPGHLFGHDLPAEDKRALIAFLKTL